MRQTKVTPDATHTTRASLFEQLGQADPAARQRAWATFNERYAPIIAGFAARCGASAHDSDDIVQDVIAAFFSKHGDFVYDPAKGRFRGWLKTCTVRAAIRRTGKTMRFNGVPLDAIPDVELAVEPIWNDVWEQQLVSDALSDLRRTHGKTAAFRAFEQYVLMDRDAVDVAAELGTSVETVYQAKTRMTRHLRDIVRRLRESDLIEPIRSPT